MAPPSGVKVTHEQVPGDSRERECDEKGCWYTLPNQANRRSALLGQF